MESKWPFMLIAFGLVFSLGLMISTIEKSNVMKNWDKRRCDFPVMTAGMFFKPDSDPRTKSKFAQDNFSFCMKSYIDKFLEIFMSPINSIFTKQTNIAGDSLNKLNTIRQITQTMYNAFSSYIGQFMRKFNNSVFEISRIVQYLRMGMRRLNAVMVSMIYTGITMFRGMLNTIQFIMKVILIICAIMIAIMIILFFILFPFIPLIISVLGAIVATVLSLIMYVSGSVAEQADSQKRGFCFSEDTKILVNGSKEISVKDIKIGDELGHNCGKVTAVIEMDGTDISLYNLNGIYVSGTHLVKGIDNIWKSVAQDERATLTTNTSKILYCFNTTSHIIPVIGTNDTILFRDWEEIADDDHYGQMMWNYIILKKLNNLSNYSKWKSGLKPSADLPLMGKNKLVKTKNGFVEISKLKILVDKVLDRNGNEHSVLGIIKGVIDNCLDNGDDKWNTELYEMDTSNVWIKGKSTVLEGKSSIEGMTIITESGEFIIWEDDEDKEKIVRDFTDVGHTSIHETYPFVASRLRTKE